jgi:D-threo-aldose 1-dehydrogenase
MFEAVTDPAEAVPVAAWDSGVRNLDTAPHYGSGLSEHRFGNVLRRYPREAFTLSTKVGRLLRPDPSRPQNAPFVDGCPSGEPKAAGALLSGLPSSPPNSDFSLACGT